MSEELKQIFRKSSFTILGDVNQTINPYYKYKSLKDLEEVFDKQTKYLELTKTYRSTKEIIDYTNKILNLNHISAIRREDSSPVLLKDYNRIKEDIKKDIEKLTKQYKSIALITKDDNEATKIYNILKSDIEITLIDKDTKSFKKDLIIIPSYMAKGLEFDSVILLNNKNNPFKEKYLYYVACTRAQHELIVYK